MSDEVAKAWAEAPDLPSLAAALNRLAAAGGRPPVTADRLVAKLRSLKAAGKPVPDKFDPTLGGCPLLPGRLTDALKGVDDWVVAVRVVKGEVPAAQASKVHRLDVEKWVRYARKAGFVECGRSLLAAEAAAPDTPPAPTDEELRTLWAASATPGDFRTAVLAMVLAKTGRVAGADLVDRWVAAARARGVVFPPPGGAAQRPPHPPKARIAPLPDDELRALWLDSATLPAFRRRVFLAVWDRSKELAHSSVVDGWVADARGRGVVFPLLGPAPPAPPRPPKPRTPPAAPKPPPPYLSDAALRDLWVSSASVREFRQRVFSLAWARSKEAVGRETVDAWVDGARNRGVPFPPHVSTRNGRPAWPALTDEALAAAWAESADLRDLRDRVRSVLGGGPSAPSVPYLYTRIRDLTRRGLVPPRRLRGQARLAAVPEEQFVGWWAAAGSADEVLAAANEYLRGMRKKPVRLATVVQLAYRLRRRGVRLKVFPRANAAAPRKNSPERAEKKARSAARYRAVADLWRVAKTPGEFWEEFRRWHAERTGRTVTRQRLSQIVDAAKRNGFEFPPKPKPTATPKPPWAESVPPERLVGLWAKADSFAAFRRLASRAYGRRLSAQSVRHLLRRRRGEGWYFAPKTTPGSVAARVVAAVWREGNRVRLAEVNERLAMVGQPPLDTKGFKVATAAARGLGLIRSRRNIKKRPTPLDALSDDELRELAREAGEAGAPGLPDPAALADLVNRRGVPAGHRPANARDVRRRLKALAK